MLYLAIIVSSLLSTGFGYLWFGPFFGKLWQSTESSSSNLSSAPLNKNLVYALNFISEIITAYVLLVSFSLLDIHTLIPAFETVLLIWIGFLAPIELSKTLWEKKSFTLFWINVLHRLCTYQIIAASIILISK